MTGVPGLGERGGSRERPLTLGYLVSASNDAEIEITAAEFAAFAHREGYTLGTVFVERTAAPAAFAALLEEADRCDATVIVVRGPQLLTCSAHLAPPGSTS